MVPTTEMLIALPCSMFTPLCCSYYSSYYSACVFTQGNDQLGLNRPACFFQSPHMLLTPTLLPRGHRMGLRVPPRSLFRWG